MNRSSVSPLLPRLALVALTVCSVPHEAAAQPTPGASADPVANDSRELLDRGFAALKRSDLEGARAAFAQAWALRPHVVVALSLAEVEMRLERFVDAAEHWQYLVTNLPSHLAEQQETAREQLQLCRKHVGSVTLQVTPDSSTVILDDKPVGEAPLGRELFLEPGAHSVYAVHAGRRSAERTFRVSPGGRLSFSLEVPMPVPAPAVPGQPQPGEPALAAASAPPADAATHRRVRTPVLMAGAGSALVAAAVGTYFAVKSGQAADEADDAWAQVNAAKDPAIPSSSACSGSNQPDACDDLAESVSDERRFRNLSIGMFVTSGVLAAATVTAFVLWKEPEGEEGRGARLSLVPLFGPVSGIEVNARF